MKSLQSGQAMTAGLVMILSILAAALFSYQIGRMIKEKSILMVAADAAAFSVAQEQASVINTLAYLNRAKIAHQIALAHLVTLASAEKFRQKQSSQALAHNPPAALIGMLFGPHHAAAYVASSASFAGGPWLPEQIQLAYRWHDQTVHELIERSQHALLTNWENRRDQVFEESLYRNLSHSNLQLDGSSSTTSMMRDPDISSSYLRKLGVKWNVIEDQTNEKVVMQNSENPEWMTMLEAAVKTQSYLGDRNFSVKNKWVIHPRCPWRRHVLRRSGETRLTKSGTWRADDTLSFHAVRSNKWIGCYMREYPMGWSLINPLSIQQQSTTTPKNFSKEAYWKWLLRREGSTKALKSYGENRLAKAWSFIDSVHLGGKGLGSYSALKSDLSEQQIKSISIRYQVTKLLMSFSVGSSIVSDSISRIPNVLSGLSHMRLSATSASEVIFAYPGVTKLSNEQAPSIFMPYWQGRISGKSQ